MSANLTAIGFFSLAMLLSGCGSVQAPAATSIPTTSRETAAPQSLTVAAPTHSPTASDNGAIFYQEDFAANTRGWQTGSESTSEGEVLRTLADGKYLISIRSNADAFGGAPSYFPNFSSGDFDMSIDATIQQTTWTDIPAELFLEFSFRETMKGTQQQWYELAFWKGNTQFALEHPTPEQPGSETIIWDWKPSSATKFEKGVTNTFRLVANGTTFAAYANGERIGTASNLVPGDGYASFSVFLTQGHESAAVAFNNLVVRRVP